MVLTKIIVGSGEENVDQSDLRSKFVLRFCKDGTISMQDCGGHIFSLSGLSHVHLRFRKPSDNRFVKDEF